MFSLLYWNEKYSHVISELIFKEVLRGGFDGKTKDKHVIRDILHDNFCYNCMGSHQVWKNFKTRWSGWKRTWPSLVSETSEWILSPTPDDAEKNSKFMPTQPWPFRNIRPIYVFVLPGFITRIFRFYKTFVDAFLWLNFVDTLSYFKNFEYDGNRTWFPNS